MSSFVFSFLWDFIDIFSPFLLLTGYPFLSRFPKLFHPAIVISAVSSVSLLFASQYTSLWNPNFGALYGYTHFLGGGALCIVCYLILSYKLGYSKPQSAVLSWLTIIAIDQLWQIPIYISHWISSTQVLEVDLITASWSFMSIPVLLYFVKKFNGRIKLTQRGLELLTVLMTFTVLGIGISISNLYLLVFPWFAFFLLTFANSRTKTPGI